MPLLKRANEQTQSEWIPVPEGLWRWQIGKPTIEFKQQWNNYQIAFPLRLTKEEQKRLVEEHGEVHPGEQQSYQTWYRVGLSLGWVDKGGVYQTTKLVDFLSACFGAGGNAKKFREWISHGGGPPRPDDLNDDKAELAAIEEWLGWWEELHVLGSITHREGDRGVFANFAGPMPVGSLPGQKDQEYEAFGRGKLRAMMTESGETREAHAQANGHKQSDPPPREQYTQDGTQVRGDGSPELPF